MFLLIFFVTKLITRLQYPLVFKSNQHQFKSVVPLLLLAATSGEVSRGWLIFFSRRHCILLPDLATLFQSLFSWKIFLMLCATRYHLCNFENVKYLHGKVLLSVKSQAGAYKFTKSNTPPWVFSTFLRLFECCQIAQSITFWRNYFY